VLFIIKPSIMNKITDYLKKIWNYVTFKKNEKKENVVEFPLEIYTPVPIPQVIYPPIEAPVKKAPVKKAPVKKAPVKKLTKKKK